MLVGEYVRVDTSNKCTLGWFELPHFTAIPFVVGGCVGRGG